MHRWAMLYNSYYPRRSTCIVGLCYTIPITHGGLHASLGYVIQYLLPTAVDMHCWAMLYYSYYPRRSTCIVGLCYTIAITHGGLHASLGYAIL